MDGQAEMDGWVEWTDVRMDGDRMQAEMHEYGHAHSHAGRRTCMHNKLRTRTREAPVG
jgi:hypothetical protein